MSPGFLRPPPIPRRIAWAIALLLPALLHGADAGARPRGLLDGACLDAKLAALEYAPLPKYFETEAKYVPKGQFTGNDSLEIPPDAKDRGGLKRIELLERLGRGGQGEVWSVNLHYDDGRVERAAFKQAEHYGKRVSPERTGALLFRKSAKAAQAAGSGVGRPGYLLPVHARLTFKSPGGRSFEGFISDMGGASVGTMSQDFQIPLNSGAAAAERAILRNALLLHDSLEAQGEAFRGGFVHLDIKPDNVLISGGKANSLGEIDSGQAQFKFIDYGIARRIGQKLDDVMGTPGFIDPSIWAQDGEIEAMPISDLFQTGTMMAENLTGLWLYPAWGSNPRAPRPHIEHAHGKFARSFHYERGYVLKALAEKRGRLQKLGVSDAHMRLYDDMVAVVDVALHKDYRERQKAARRNLDRQMRIEPSKAGEAVAGAGEELKTHLREAMAARKPRNPEENPLASDPAAGHDAVTRPSGPTRPAWPPAETRTESDE